MIQIQYYPHSGAGTFNSRGFMFDPDRTTIRGITLREPLVIENIDCQTDLVFVSCYFEETVYIRSGTFKKFSISGGRITHPFMIDGERFNGKSELDQEMPRI